jgi:integrase/recombinase XerD
VNTQANYQREIVAFRTFINKPLAEVAGSDAEAFAAHLDGLPLAPSSRRRALSTVKSLFAFLTRMEHIARDVMRSLRLPRAKDELARRIMDEDDVLRLVAAPLSRRDRAIMDTLYDGALRVSELTALTWRDVRRRGDAGQLTVFGKGSKTRAVMISHETMAAIAALRGDAGDADPVFRSRHGKALSRRQVLRIVKAAAAIAGVDAGVSPHWLRHCHASHALDNGAAIHLVQATLGHASVATTSRYLHCRPAESSGAFLHRPRGRRPVMHKPSTRPRGGIAAPLRRSAGRRVVGVGKAPQTGRVAAVR